MSGDGLEGDERCGASPCAAALALLALAACGPGAGRGPASSPFGFDRSAFGTTPPPASKAFDAVSADMDLDGDPDLLVNWHNTGRLELFENQGGSFRLVNPYADDRSGLYENVGVSDLYADSGELAARVLELGQPGVYVWHGENPGDSWDVKSRDGWNLVAIPGDGPVRIGLRTNCALELDLDERRVERRGEFAAEVVLDEPTHFRTRLDFISTQLVVESSLPIHVGRSLRSVPGTEVELWKDDVHGMAWVDVLGSPEPDLYLTNGGLRGALAPPHDPKRDRFFVHAGPDPLYRDRRDALPANYGRGRRVEWVDLDADGALELYVGNTETPNALLEILPDGTLRDIAPELGLDLLRGETFAWLDVDGDGRDDVVLLDGETFRVAYQGGGRSFELRSGEEVGLVFPARAELDEPRVIDSLSLFVVDQDADGRLDLWLAGHARGHTLYRATPEGRFVDRTAAAGLEGLGEVRSLALGDFDNDGYVDALAIGVPTRLLWNESGARFRAEAFGGERQIPGTALAVALDADGDGRLDLALAAGGMVLARNQVERAGEALVAALGSEGGAPVGTLVTAAYASGARLVQRYGSAGSTRYSQGLAPLVFGIAPGERIERLEVRWPDGRTETREVAPHERSVHLERSVHSRRSDGQ